MSVLVSCHCVNGHLSAGVQGQIVLNIITVIGQNLFLERERKWTAVLINTALDTDSKTYRVYCHCVWGVDRVDYACLCRKISSNCASWKNKPQMKEATMKEFDSALYGAVSFCFVFVFCFHVVNDWSRLTKVTFTQKDFLRDYYTQGRESAYSVIDYYTQGSDSAYWLLHTGEGQCLSIAAHRGETVLIMHGFWEIQTLVFPGTNSNHDDSDFNCPGNLSIVARKPFVTHIDCRISYFFLMSLFQRHMKM